MTCAWMSSIVGRLDHDPDLPAGLHGEDLLDALLGQRDLLQPLQPLDVGLERLPARAGTAAADRVGGLGQHRLDRAHLDLVVVRLDRVHHVLGLAVPAGDLRPDQRVAALDLMGQRLADVVQHRAALHQHRVHAELAGHHAGDVGGLDQVLEHVLAVRGAVAEPAEQVGELGMQVGDGQVHERVLARLDAELLDLRLAPLVGLLDALRVDPPVQDQPLQGQPAHLPAYRVEAGQQHRLRRVVDDQVDAGDRLERPDVAALPADDPALHLVAGQVQHGHHGLAGLLAGDPLDGQCHDLARALLAVGARLVLDVPDDQRGLALGLVLDAGDQLGLGLVGGQAGHPLQHLAALLVELVEFLAPRVEILLEPVQVGGPLVDPAGFLVGPLLPLGQPGLPAFQVPAELPDLVLDGPDLVLDLAAALRDLLGGGLGLLHDGGRVGLRPRAHLIGLAHRARPVAAASAHWPAGWPSRPGRPGPQSGRGTCESRRPARTGTRPARTPARSPR